MNWARVTALSGLVSFSGWIILSRRMRPTAKRAVAPTKPFLRRLAEKRLAAVMTIAAARLQAIQPSGKGTSIPQTKKPQEAPVACLSENRNGPQNGSSIQDVARAPSQ